MPVIVLPGSATSARSIPALLARCDVYEFAGSTVFTRGAGNVTIPATTTLYDGGRYPDLLAFLNGYGSQLGQSMSEALNADWTAGGGVPATWEVGIDETDRIYVRVLTAEIASFAVQSATGNPWGFASGATSSTTVGSYQVVTAPDAWERGNLDLWNVGQGFTVNDGLTFGGLYNEDVTVHSLPVALRAYDAEADGVFPTDTSRYEKRGVAIIVPEWISETASSATSARSSARTPSSAKRCTTPSIWTTRPAPSSPPPRAGRPGLQCRRRAEPLVLPALEQPSPLAPHAQCNHKLQIK